MYLCAKSIHMHNVEVHVQKFYVDDHICKVIILHGSPNLAKNENINFYFIK